MLISITIDPDRLLELARAEAESHLRSLYGKRWVLDGFLQDNTATFTATIKEPDAPKE